MAAKDLWANIDSYPGGTLSSMTGPACASATVTPSDSTDLAIVTRAVYVGADGSMKVTLLDGSTPTFLLLKAGTMLPLRVTRIWATPTPCTSIIALW